MNDTAHTSRRRTSVRVLLYSHDTFGLGHFRRCLKIARSLNRTLPESSVLLLTGSPLAHRYALPDGVDFVKLPAVIKTGQGQYAARSSRLPIADLIRIRSGIIRTTVAEYQPDVLLVDHAPLGLSGEVLPVLRYLRTRPRPPLTILGLRDILDEPDRVIATWTKEGVYPVLHDLYDRIVVYGTPSIYDPAEAYRIPDDVREKIHYSGYISGQDGDSRRPSRPRKTADTRHVLLTVGGGEDGTEIVATYLDMLRQHGTNINFTSTILPGPLLSNGSLNTLRKEGRGLPVRFHHFVSEVGPLMGRADLTVSMGGYNAVTEILAFAHKALVIPRVRPRREQLMRATCFKDLGLISMLSPDNLDPDILLRQITQQLSDTRTPLEDARREHRVPTDGADQFAHLVQEFLAARDSDSAQADRVPRSHRVPESL